MTASSKRLTIGLLSENSSYTSEELIVQGIAEAAEQADVNFVYLGYFGIYFDDVRFESDIESNERLAAKFEQLRESIDLYELDGLLIIGWSKDVHGSRLEHFRRVTNGLPVVSLGGAVDCFPLLRVRGYTYLYEATKHLIEDHGRRRIAFIEPWKHDTRVDGYRAAIKDAGLSSDDITIKYEDVADTVDHGVRTTRALCILLDERRADIDAIIVLSSTEGKIVLQELQRRGFRVPEDISLICYEDELSMRFASVPLTTVYYPYREIGELGCRALVRMLQGETVEPDQIVPTRVVYRSSCGCNRSHNSIMRKLDRRVSSDLQDDSDDVPVQLPCLDELPALRQLDLSKLTGLFGEAVITGRYTSFLNAFRKEMLELHLHNEQDPRILETELVQSFVSAILPAVRNDAELLERVQELCAYIRDIIEIKEKNDTFQRFEQAQTMQKALTHVGKTLLSSYDLQTVLKHLNDYMGWLQIPTLYLFQHKDDRNGLLFGFQEHQNMTWRFPERADLKTVFQQYKAIRQERFTLMILPLHLKCESIGVLWVDPGSNVSSTLVTLSDYIKSALKGCMLFEESQQLINQIQETKELLESYIQHTSDGIVVINEHASIIRVNEAVRVIFGWEESELLGRGVSVLTGERFDYELVRKRLASGSNPKDIEMIGRRRDGSVRDLNLTLSPIRDRRGDIRAIALLFRDVTESKKTEEYLRKQDKLSVVGQLAAGLAHEIRNPLTPLKGFTQMLREESVPYRLPIYDLMLSELERIDTIVRDFLTVAKPQVSVRSRINLYDLVRNVITFLEPQSLLLGIILELHAENGGADALIEGSDAEIKQVFVNLIKNGMEAMPSGGTLTVTLDVQTADSIMVIIEDQGVGIPKEKLALIGEPFFTTKDTGTGLGMMMCYKIIHAHGGQLYIRSEEGSGTVVEVVMPISQEGPQ